MAKNICKRSLSTLLAVLMVVTTFCFADLGLTASATVSSSAMGTSIYFYVPETIYVQPANGTVLQYFVDRANADNGALDTSNAKTSGNIYFKCSDTSAKVTGLTVSSDVGFSAAPSIRATSSSSNTLSTTISGGSLASALGSNGTTQLTWTVTYQSKGQTLTAKAYSTVYRNLVGNSSLIAASAHGRYTKRNHTTASICVTSWVAGAHSANFTQATNPDGFTGNTSGGGDNSGSYNGRVLEATTIPQASEKSTNIGEGGTGWSGYWASEKDVDYTGGAGWIHVDTSRYGNLGQIPNLKYGIDNNYELSGKNDIGRLYYRRQGGSDTEVYYWSGTNPPIRETVQTFNIGVGGTGNFWIQIYGYGMKQANSDRYSRARCYLYVNQYSKGDLRNAINNEVAQNRQAAWYTSASWSTYCSYMKQAYAVLGNPLNTDTGSGTNAVTSAVNSLVRVTGTASATHKSARNTSRELGTDAQITFNYGDTVTSAANSYTGYTFLKQQRGSNAESTSSSESVYYAASSPLNWVYYYQPNQ